MQVILENIKQRGAYSVLRLISVRSKQEEARELSEDMLGSPSPLGGHANGRQEHFMGLGDLMGLKWGPGTAR